MLVLMSAHASDDGVSDEDHEDDRSDCESSLLAPSSPLRLFLGRLINRLEAYRRHESLNDAHQEVYDKSEYTGRDGSGEDLQIVRRSDPGEYHVTETAGSDERSHRHQSYRRYSGYPDACHDDGKRHRYLDFSKHLPSRKTDAFRRFDHFRVDAGYSCICILDDRKQRIQRHHEDGRQHSYPQERDRKTEHGHARNGLYDVRYTDDRFR